MANFNQEHFKSSLKNVEASPPKSSNSHIFNPIPLHFQSALINKEEDKFIKEPIKTEKSLATKQDSLKSITKTQKSSRSATASPMKEIEASEKASLKLNKETSYSANVSPNQHSEKGKNNAKDEINLKKNNRNRSKSPSYKNRSDSPAVLPESRSISASSLSQMPNVNKLQSQSPINLLEKKSLSRDDRLSSRSVSLAPNGSCYSDEENKKNVLNSKISEAVCTDNIDKQTLKRERNMDNLVDSLQKTKDSQFSAVFKKIF